VPVSSAINSPISFAESLPQGLHVPWSARDAFNRWAEVSLYVEIPTANVYKLLPSVFAKHDSDQVALCRAPYPELDVFCQRVLFRERLGFFFFSFGSHRTFLTFAFMSGSSTRASRTGLILDGRAKRPRAGRHMFGPIVDPGFLIVVYPQYCSLSMFCR
jgi:hypothetical protein